MKTRRIGRFEISYDMIDHDEATVRTVMGRCVIVRCESMWESDAISYVAISPDFDEVQQGECVPHYYVYISENGKHIEFKRFNK